MGIIITKFRKKKTTYEILEKLENEIQSIEEFRRSTEQTQKKMVGRFIFISICVYCLTAFVLYFYFFPASAYERIIYIIPFIIIPVLLIFIKRILTWYYNRKIVKNQKKLTSLKDEKKKILEEVMDKETYKVAKTILDKFAPEQIKKNMSLITTEATPLKPGPTPSVPSSSVVPSQTGLRYRGQFGVTPSQLALGPSATPRSRQPFQPSGTSVVARTPHLQSMLPTVNNPGTPLPLPRAILPRERSVLDKMVDYLIGDGPSNRYALICKHCSSHNGMALKEEFDYLSFRCCYCLAFNPARKKRPSAPKLDVSRAIKNKRSDVSDSDQNSPSDSDTDSDVCRPIITEPDSDSVEERKNLTGNESTGGSDVDRMSNLDDKSSPVDSSSMDVDSFEKLPEKTNGIEDVNLHEHKVDDNDKEIVSQEITKQD